MKNPGLLSGIFGLTGVALGAFGAHALKNFLLTHGTSDAWETGVRYHLLHAVTLLALAAWTERRTTPPGRDWLTDAAHCWTAGIVLFSGSLYGYALGGPHFLVFVTPLGGIAFLLGWSAIIIHALTAPKNS